MRGARVHECVYAVLLKQVSRDDSGSSEDYNKSSDDWSTVSLELSDETREGRPEQDPRPRPVDLGPQEADTAAFVDVSGGDGGVLKRVAREGDGVLALDGFTVDMKYVLMALDGTLVDVSMNDMWPNKEHKFIVGRGEVMSGMDVAAKCMKRREKARFRIRADYAFGDAGCPPKIAPGTAWLVLDAEMMGIRRPHRDKLFLRDNEVMLYVVRHKEQGNEFYKGGDFVKAVHEYKSCTKAIAQMQDDTYRHEMRGPATQLLGNLAAAHLALGNWRRAIKYCTQVLAIEPSNDKALFRRAQALRKYPERLEEARKDMCEAIRIAPANKQLRLEYNTLLEEVKLKRRADKLAYGTIFDKQGTIYAAQRPRVFFELSQGKKLVGRVEIELFSDTVPKAAENFRALCVGFPEATKKLHYQGTTLHRIIEDYIVQGGDVSGKVSACNVCVYAKVPFCVVCCLMAHAAQGGLGGESIYGPRFADESLAGKTDRAGVVCMANSGPNTNASQVCARGTDRRRRFAV